MANNPNAKANLVPFVKGDKRINRRGRIVKTRDKLRDEWQAIWAEIMFDDKGNPIIDEVTGKALTRLQARMRTMTTSRNVKELELALAYTYGKPKDEVELTGKDGNVLEIVIRKASDATGNNNQ